MIHIAPLPFSSMRRQIRTNPAMLIVMLVFSLRASGAWGADIGVKRLAVLDAGPEQKAPGAVMDLFCLKLHEQKNVTLLERENIAKLLKEQRIGLTSAGEIDPSEAVRAGRILTADAFCFLESVKVATNKPLLRVRLVDAWYGIKVMDITLPSPSAGECERLAGALADKVITRLSAITREPKDMRLVGVLNFKSLEPSKRWDHLSQSIQAGLEYQLSALPGVVLVERAKTADLSAERALVTGLPEALAASTLVVDGEFEVRRGKESTLLVGFRCRRNGQTIDSFRIEKRLDDVAGLCREAASSIARKVGLDKAGPMDSRREADMLMEQAAAASTRFDADAAMEAAMALAPDCDAYTVTFITAIEPDLWKGINEDLARRRLAAISQLVDHWAHDNKFKYGPDAEKALAYLPRLLHPKDLSGKALNEFVGNEGRPLFRRTLDFLKSVDRAAYADYLLRSLSEPLLWPDASAKQNALGECREILKTKGGEPYARLLAFYLAQPEFWPNDYTEAVGSLSNAVTAFIELNVLSVRIPWPNYTSLPGIQIYASDALIDRFLDDKRWSHRKDAGALLLAMFHGLAAQDNIKLRVTGERGLLYYALKWKDPPDYAERRQKFENFERSFLQELPGKSGEYNDSQWIMPLLVEYSLPSILFQNREVRYAAGDKENADFKAEHVERIYNAVLDRELYGDLNWFAAGEEFGTGSALYWLEKAGKINEADSLMTRICAASKKYKNGKWFRFHQQSLAAFRGRHPELAVSSEAKSDYRAVTLLSDKEVPLLSDARALAIQPDAALVVCKDGIIYLDPATLALKSIVPCGKGLGVELDGKAVIENGKIYAVCNKGVVILDGGKPWLFSEENGFPSDTGGDIDVLKGKIYAQYGGESLFEADPATRTSRLIMSSKASVKEQPLKKFSRIWKHIADPWGGRILIAVVDVSSGSDSAVYEFVPGADAMKQVYTSLVIRAGYRRYNELIQPWANRVLFGDITRGAQICSVMTSGIGRLIGFSCFCRIGDGMICKHEDKIEYFRKTKDEPEDMKHRFFPGDLGKGLDPCDMMMHAKGLLILSRGNLHLVPDMRKDADKKIEEFGDKRPRGPKEAYYLFGKALVLTVKPQTGDIAGKKTYDLYVEALLLPPGPSYDYPEAQKIYREIYTKYPGTLIEEEARFEEIRQCVNPRNWEERKHWIDAFKKDYPDSRSFSALDKLVKFIERFRLENAKTIEIWRAEDEARRSKQTDSEK